MSKLTVGSATGKPGALVTGFLEGLRQVTGQRDDIPVMIAQAREPGPVIWLTAGIHGNELTGMQVVQRLMQDGLASRLRCGTVVGVPVACPSGLRLRSRTTEYDERDPNRLFPATYFRKEPESSSEPLTAQQRALHRLYHALIDSADVHLDLHCAMLHSVPFLFRDRVFWRNEEDRTSRERLNQRVQELVEASGLPVINELPPQKYLSSNLHRSFSGATLNDAGIPSCTIELGPQEVLIEDMVEAGIAAVENVLRWAEMLDGAITPLPHTPMPGDGHGALRHVSGPYAPATGLRHFPKRPGEWIRAGETVVRITDVFGQTLDGGVVTLDHDAWLVGTYTGCLAYKHSPVALLAVRDDTPTLARHPDWNGKR